MLGMLLLCCYHILRVAFNLFIVCEGGRGGREGGRGRVGEGGTGRNREGEGRWEREEEGGREREEEREGEWRMIQD